MAIPAKIRAAFENADSECLRFQRLAGAENGGAYRPAGSTDLISVSLEGKRLTDQTGSSGSTRRKSVYSTGTTPSVSTVPTNKAKTIMDAMP